MRKEDALIFGGIFCANVNFRAKSGKLVEKGGYSSFDVSPGFKG